LSREEERENPNQKKKNRLKTEIPPQIQIIHPSTLTIEEEEEEEENQKKKKSNQSTIRPKNQKKISLLDLAIPMQHKNTIRSSPSPNRFRPSQIYSDTIRFESNH